MNYRKKQIVFNGQILEASIITTAKGNDYYHFTPSDKRERIIAVGNPCVRPVVSDVPLMFGLIPAQIRALQNASGDKAFRRIA